MIDLLVSSLMADGGLEMALSAAIKCKYLLIKLEPDLQCFPTGFNSCGALSYLAE